MNKVVVGENGPTKGLNGVLSDPANAGRTIAVMPGCYFIGGVTPTSGQSLVGVIDNQGFAPVFHGNDEKSIGIRTPPLDEDGNEIGPRAYSTNVVVRNLDLRHYASRSGYTGAIQVQSSKAKDREPGPGLNWLLENVMVIDNDGTGVVLAPQTTLRNSTVANNTYLGIGGGRGEGVVIDGVDVYGNSATSGTHVRQEDENYGVWWHAGGMKLVKAINATVTNSWIHDNLSQGIWLDVGTNNPTIDGNRLERNSGAGIMHEISFGGRITNNVVLDHGWSRVQDEFDEGLWPAGILVATSSGVLVEKNYVDQTRNPDLDLDPALDRDLLPDPDPDPDNDGRPAQRVSAGISIVDRNREDSWATLLDETDLSYIPDPAPDAPVGPGVEPGPIDTSRFSASSNLVQNNVICNADRSGLLYANSDAAGNQVHRDNLASNGYSQANNTFYNVGRWADIRSDGAGNWPALADTVAACPVVPAGFPGGG